MSLYEYTVSRKLVEKDYPFYSLIMAAMRRADTDNLAKLRAAWPAVWAEFQPRYHAPEGVLSDELVGETNA
jgi:hypothetical protein